MAAESIIIPLSISGPITAGLVSWVSWQVRKGGSETWGPRLDKRLEKIETTLGDLNTRVSHIEGRLSQHGAP